jgi:hypothetical protein
VSLAELIAGKLPAAVGSVAKVAKVAVANTAERESTKPTTATEPVKALPHGQLATATFATPATQGPAALLPGGSAAGTTLGTDGEALRAALAEAGEGLPVTVAELLREFGAEGREGWEAGDYAHPAFLRAFAVAVAERLERERQTKPEPPPRPSHPLDGLALLREDWEFIERRSGGRHREALLNEYARHWKEAAAAEPVEFRKANAGRFAANSWLLDATK